MKTVLTFDLDGTLIQSKNKIIGGERTLSLLRQISDMGIELVINTGRLDHDIIAICDKYNLAINHRISQNGCVVFNDNQINAVLMDTNEAKEVYKFLKKKENVRTELNTISNRYWNTPREFFRPKEYYDSHIISKDFTEVLEYQPVVLFLCLGSEDDLKEIKKYVLENFHQIYPVMTSPKSLEILPKNVSKGNALKDAFPHEYIYGIGDSENDYSVFEVANESFYVGNDEVAIEGCQKVNQIDEALQIIVERLGGTR